LYVRKSTQSRIYFNKQCLARKLTPAYARIKVLNTSPAHIHTKHKATIMRIEDEVMYLHCKKTKASAHYKKTTDSHMLTTHSLNPKSSGTSKQNSLTTMP